MTAYMIRQFTSAGDDCPDSQGDSRVLDAGRSTLAMSILGESWRRAVGWDCDRERCAAARATGASRKWRLEARETKRC